MRKLSQNGNFGCFWVGAWPVLSVLGYFVASGFWPWIVAGVICGLGYHRALMDSRANEVTLTTVVSQLLTEHRRALAVRFVQTVVKDVYGVEHRDKWLNEEDYFIDNVIVPRLPAGILADRAALRAEIEDVAIAEAGTFDDLYSPRMSGADYEQYCAAVLRSAGWNVRTTRATGDQGIDLVGEKDGEWVVFQCKHYSQPVGNKAVQEVIAGKTFERVKHAAVISNASYTPSAMQLAASDGVILLHHTDLYDLKVSRFLAGSVLAPYRPAG